MNIESRHDKWAGWSAVSIPAIFVIGWTLAPNPPKVTASATTVAKYFSTNADAVLRQTFVAGFVVSVFLLVFVAGLWNFLRRGGDDSGASSLALIAGVGIFPGFVVLAATHAGLASVTGVSDSTVWAIWRVSTFADLLTSLFIGVFIGAVSISTARSRVLPRWVTWLGALAALSQLIMQLNVVLKGARLSQDSAFGGLSLGLFMVWVAAVGVAMIRRPSSGATIVEAHQQPHVTSATA